MKAVHLVRRRGTVVSVGVPGAPIWPLPVGRAFADELTLRFAIGDLMRDGDALVALLRSGVLDPTVLVSETVGLDDVPEAYRRMAERRSLKTLITIASAASIAPTRPLVSISPSASPRREPSAMSASSVTARRRTWPAEAHDASRRTGRATCPRRTRATNCVVPWRVRSGPEGERRGTAQAGRPRRCHQR